MFKDKDVEKVKKDGYEQSRKCEWRDRKSEQKPKEIQELKSMMIKMKNSLKGFKAVWADRRITRDIIY